MSLDSNQPLYPIHQTTYINNTHLEYLDYLALKNSSKSHDLLFYISRIIYKNQHVGLLVCYVTKSLHSPTNSVKRIKRVSCPHPYFIQFINPSHLPKHLVKDFLSRFSLNPYPSYHSLGFQIQKTKCERKNVLKNFFLVLNETNYGRQINFIFCLHPFLKNHVDETLKRQQLKCFGVIDAKQMNKVSYVNKAQHFFVDKREHELNEYFQSFSYAKKHLEPLPCLLNSFVWSQQDKTQDYCFTKHSDVVIKRPLFLTKKVAVETSYEKSRNLTDEELVTKVQECVLTFEERLQCFIKLCYLLENIIKGNEKSVQRCSFVDSKEWKTSGEALWCSRLPMKKCLRKSLLSTQFTSWPNLLVPCNAESEASLKSLKSTYQFSLPTCVPEKNQFKQGIAGNGTMKTEKKKQVVIKRKVSLQVGNVESCRETKKIENRVARPLKQYMQPTQASVNRTKLQLEQFVSLQNVCDTKNVAYRKK